jgi:hypothetical protein
MVANFRRIIARLGDPINEDSRRAGVEGAYLNNGDKRRLPRMQPSAFRRWLKAVIIAVRITGEGIRADDYLWLETPAGFVRFVPGPGPRPR